MIAAMNEGYLVQVLMNVWAYIDSLLVKAIDHLDLFYTFSSTERAGRASQASAWFLRSRLWLYAASPLYNGMTSPTGKSYAHLVPKDKEGNELISTVLITLNGKRQWR